MRKILLAPGTTEIASEIFRSLRLVKGIEIYAATTDVEKALAMGFSNVKYVPDIENQEAISVLVDFATENEIDYIWPCHDEWSFKLNQGLFPPKVVVINESPNQKVLRFKSFTYDALQGALKIPLTYANRKSILNYPVFLKPDAGQGSQGAKIIQSPDELESYLDIHGSLKTGWILSEYLPGPEYTVDCFSDLQGKLLYSRGRSRATVRNGIANKTFSIVDAKIEKIAKQIAAVLKLSGAWFFQLKTSNTGELALLEVAHRIAGASGLNRLSGVNLAELNLLQIEGDTIEILDQPQDFLSFKLIEDVVLSYDYFDQVFVDFDDTLEVNGLLNSNLFKFLLDCRNTGSSLHLITRHKGDLNKSLERHGLQHFFDSVVHLLDDREPKADAIFGATPLFVDDSFRERRNVLQKTNALCLGPEAFNSRWVFSREVGR